MADADFSPCPNCQNGEIICLPSGVADGHNQSGVYIGGFRSVSFARLICLQCGFVREWIATQEGLDLLRKKYGREQR